jgi:hypothetical protein
MVAATTGVQTKEQVVLVSVSLFMIASGIAGIVEAVYWSGSPVGLRTTYYRKKRKKRRRKKRRRRIRTTTKTTVKRILPHTCCSGIPGRGDLCYFR